MTTLGNAKMVSLKDKLNEQEDSLKSSVEEKKVKVIKEKGRVKEKVKKLT